MMGMGDCNRQRVGRVRSSDFRSGQEAHDHGVNLGLFRCAGSDHRLFHKPCRIFPDIDPGSRRAHQNHASRLPKLEGRLGVLIDKHLLDGSGAGRMVVDQRLELISERREAPRKRRGGFSSNLSVRDVPEPIAFGLDQPPARGTEPRVKTEDSQANFSSSSSGTS